MACFIYIHFHPPPPSKKPRKFLEENGGLTYNPQKTSPQKMSEYKVAIPSYQRSDIIGQKTLHTLIQGKVPLEKIHIFVANDTEKALYISKIKEQYPHYPLKNIHVGVLGITPQRQFISHFFPKNTPIVSLDDDVEQVYQLSSYRPFSSKHSSQSSKTLKTQQRNKTQRKTTPKKESNRLVKLTNLDQFFQKSFEYTLQQNLHIWGVYPVNNPFFMQPKTTTDLRFLIGGFYGYINRPTAPELKVTVPIKEDYENTILHYIHDGGVVRFNGVSYKSKNYSPGGLEKAETRIESNRKASEMLLKRYPAYVSKRPTRANGVVEIALIKNPTPNP